MTLPVSDRELCIVGSDWQRVLSIDVGTVSELFSLADRGRLAALDRTIDPSASFDVMVGEASIGLWLAHERLAVIPTPLEKT